MNKKRRLKIEPSMQNMMSKTRLLIIINIIQKKQLMIPERITIVFDIQLPKSISLIFIHQK